MRQEKGTILRQVKCLFQLSFAPSTPSVPRLIPVPKWAFRHGVLQMQDVLGGDGGHMEALPPP